MHVIIIDDSKLDCFIAEKVIQNTGKSESVRTFSVATDALDYLKNLPVGTDVLIFVDIQMPIMTGFEFVEQFQRVIPEEIRRSIKINLLSSSINESDRIRATAYPCVRSFLSKPLTKNALETMFAGI